MGATDILGRLASSIYGFDGLAPTFTACYDVPNGGVLLALPAVLVSGLLSCSAKHFQLPPGFYRLDTIFLLLAFMALARLKIIEYLRYCSPGEWGKLLGFDRSPEVKTLRRKIRIMAQEGEPFAWAGELSKGWMDLEPEVAGVLYIDGHVRVYSGSQTELPRHYVSRQKLCLRATTDYWVNAMDGRPFFMINKEIDPGLLAVLENDIIPRLDREVPEQQSLFKLEEDPYLHRFTLIYDREGYSPAFMKRMKEKRIACQTYHKYPDGSWPENEFQVYKVTLSSGNIIEMKLAERGIFLGKKLWVREVRKLCKSCHQTSIISTDYHNDLIRISVAMFARWSQENFFKYMRNQYNIDALIDYSLEDIDETTFVVNPQYREMDGKVRKQAAILNRKKKEFNEIMLEDDIEPEKVEAYEQKKSELQEEIIAMEQDTEDLKACRKATPKHVTMRDLPEEDRFQRLGTRGKHLVDTIKMITYRAETSMVNIVKEKMSRGDDDARRLLQAVYKNEVDLLPDYENEILKVRLHHIANKSSSETLRHLCSELNATNTLFPATNLRMVYELVS